MHKARQILSQIKRKVRIEGSHISQWLLFQINKGVTALCIEAVQTDALIFFLSCFRDVQIKNTFVMLFTFTRRKFEFIQ